MDTEKIEKLKIRLCGKDRTEAIIELENLDTNDLRELFPELVFLASFIHGQLRDVREIILRIPKPWIIQNIEKHSQPILAKGSYDEYRRLLELYSLLDKDLAKKLAARAVQHQDPEIKDAGEEFLARVN